MSGRVDVAVVGAGPAGLAAAVAAAGAGARTLLIDEAAAVGGQLRYRGGLFSGPSGIAVTGPQLADELGQSAARAGVEVCLETVVWGIFAGNELELRRHGISETVRPEGVVLATGSTDRALLFPGASLPGVFTGRALQLLLNVHRVRPGRRFALIGASETTDELASDIVRAGGEVVARATGEQGLAAGGRHGIEWIEIDGRRHDVDVIAVAVGRLPDFTLAQMAECDLGYDAETERFAPIRDQRLATTVPGLFLAGDAAGPANPAVAMAEGTLAGLHAAAAAGHASDDARVRDAVAALDAAAPGRRGARSAIAPSFNQVDRAAMGTRA